jgi:hypothetical protein
MVAAIFFRPFEILTGYFLTSLDHFIRKGHKKYFIQAKTVLASEKNIRSGFQMVETKWPPQFENQTGYFLTSLNRFGMNKIFFMALFFIKRSRLATEHECPVFGCSAKQMVGTGIRFNPNTARGSVFGGLL